LSDLDSVEKNLARKGFSFRTPPWLFSNVLDNTGIPETKVTHVEDPDGVQVELVQVV